MKLDLFWFRQSTRFILLVPALAGCQLVDNTIRGSLLPRNPPSISSIADQSVVEGGVTNPVPFTLSGLTGATGSSHCTSAVDTSTSDASLVPLSGIAISGTVPNCSLFIMSAPTGTGSVTITLAVQSRNQTATRTFQVNILSVTAPPNPTSPTATPVSPTQIDLGWTSGGGSTADYRISYQVGAIAPANCATGTAISEASITGTSHAVTGLTAGTQYSFRICAINGNATPDVSSGVTVSAVTLQLPPPDPSSPAVVTVASGYLLLQWTSGGLTTSNFRISYQTGPSAPLDCASGQVISEVDILPNYHVVGPLQPGTEYSFRICAINSNPTPDVSSGVTITTNSAVARLSTVQDIAVGEDVSCAIDQSGKLWCWGSGILGDGTGLGSMTPVEVAGGASWLSVSVGEYFGCAIRASDNRILCWGNGSNGRRGDGTNNITVNSPVLINSGQTFKKVDVSDNHACAISINDDAYCWGSSGSGEVGNGSTGTVLSPALVTGGHKWQTVSAGASHSCGVRQTDGAVLCWGRGSSGQIGNNSTTLTNSSPTPISGGGVWKAVSAGWDHTCAIKDDDSLWCWGRGAEGQLGDGDTVNRLVPTPVAVGEQWKYVETFYHQGRGTCAIKFSDSSLWCWGHPKLGMLGTGIWEPLLVPTPVIGGGTWKKVVGANGSTCGIRGDDSLRCWGSNERGNSSRGLAVDVPRAFGGGHKWKKLSNSEGLSACAIRNDDSLWCWGPNVGGELGDGTTVSRYTPGPVVGPAGWFEVSLGRHHGCGLGVDESLWCWGSGENGEIGNGTTSNQFTPNAVRLAAHLFEFLEFPIFA